MTDFPFTEMRGEVRIEDGVPVVRLVTEVQRPKYVSLRDMAIAQENQLWERFVNARFRETLK